jgi:hypothetical protein
MKARNTRVDQIGRKSSAHRSQIFGRLVNEFPRFKDELLVECVHTAACEHGGVAARLPTARFDQLKFAGVPGIFPILVPASVVITKAGSAATAPGLARSARTKEKPSIRGMFTSTITRSNVRQTFRWLPCH